MMKKHLLCLLMACASIVFVNAQCPELGSVSPSPQPTECQNAMTRGNLLPYLDVCQTVCFNNTNAGNSGQVGDVSCVGSDLNDLYLFVNNPYAHIPGYDGSLVFRWVDWPNKGSGAIPPAMGVHAEIAGSGFPIGLSIDCTSPAPTQSNNFALENAICIDPASTTGNQFFAGAGTLPTLAGIQPLVDAMSPISISVNDISYWLQMVTSDGGQGNICFEISQYESGFICGDPDTLALTGGAGSVSTTASACLCQTALYGGLLNEANLGNGVPPCQIESPASAWYYFEAPFGCNEITVDMTSWGGSGNYNVAILKDVTCPDVVQVNPITGAVTTSPGATMNTGSSIEAATCGGTLVSDPMPGGGYYLYISGESERPNFTFNMTILDAATDAGFASSSQNNTNVCSGTTVEASTNGALVPLNATRGQDIAWFYSTNIAFNPYRGQGTYAASGQSNVAIDLPANTDCSPISWYIKGVVSDDGTNAEAGCEDATNTITVTVYPEIGVPSVLNTQCLITVAARCSNFTVNGDAGVSSYTATFADDSTTESFVISNGLQQCNTVISELISCSGNCTQPVASGTSACDANDPFNFYVDVQFSPGSASTYFITDTEGGSFPVSGAGAYRVGPYANNSTVFITVENTDDSNCNLPLGAFNNDCNTIFCPNLTSANLTLNGNVCSGEFLILSATVDQGVVNQDFIIEWYQNGDLIPGANTMASLVTLETAQTCDPEVQVFEAEIRCLLPDGTPSSTARLNAGSLVVYPKPQLGIDIVKNPANCIVSPVDRCGNLTMTHTPNVDLNPGDAGTQIDFTAFITGAPSGCSTSGSYTVICPTCITNAGEGVQPAKRTVCFGETFDVGVAGTSLSNNYTLGWAVTDVAPYGNPNAAVADAIANGNLIGPDDGSTIYTFTGGTDYTPGDQFFIPFTSLDGISNASPIFQQSGSVNAPFGQSQNTATITVPQLTYCDGVTTFNMNFSANQTSGVGNPIDNVSGLLSQGGATTNVNINRNSYTGNPSGQSVTIAVSSFFGANVNYSLTISYETNVNFPTICPSCNDVGEPVHVNILPDIILTPAPPLVLCEGSEFDLTKLNPIANVPGDFVWYDGDPNNGGQAIADPRTLIANDGDQYFALFASKADSTCTRQTSVTLQTNPLPVLNPIPAQPELCLGETVDLTTLENGLTTTAGAVIWYKGDPDNGGVRLPNVFAQNLAPSNGQPYFALFEDFITGCRNKTDVAFTVNPLPVLSPLPPQTICAGDTFSLASVESNITSESGVFQWYLGDPDAGGTLLSLADAANQIPTGNDSYTGVFTNITTGCESRTSIDFNVNPLPNLAQLPDQGPICSGEVADLTDLEGNIILEPGIFTWFIGDPANGGTLLSAADAANQVPTGNETYFVNFRNALTGCSNQINFGYEVEPAPQLNAIPAQVICAGDEVDLGDIETNLTGLPGFYLWYNGNPQNGGTLLTVQEVAAQTPDGSEVYYVVFTSFLNNCSAMDSLSFTVNASPTLDTLADFAALCAGEQVDLTSYEDSLSTEVGVWAWYSGDPDFGGTELIGADAEELLPVNGRSYFGQFTLGATGCVKTTEMNFTVVPAVSGAAANYDCAADQLVVDLSGVTGGTETGFGVDSNSANVDGESISNGSPWQVLVTDSLGCGQTISGIVDCIDCSAGIARSDSGLSICCDEMLHLEIDSLVIDNGIAVAWAMTAEADGPVTDTSSVSAAADAGMVFPANADGSYDLHYNCGSVTPGNYYMTPLLVQNDSVQPVVWDTLAGCRPRAQICPDLRGADWVINPLIFTFPDGSSLNVNDEIAFGLAIDSPLVEALGGLPCIELSGLFSGDPNGTWGIDLTNIGTGTLNFSAPDIILVVSADTCTLINQDQVVIIPGVTGSVAGNSQTLIEFEIPPLPAGFPAIDAGCEAYGDPVLITFVDPDTCSPDTSNTGIQSLITEDELSIYPNPSSGLFHVQAELHKFVQEGYTIQVTNQLGQTNYIKRGAVFGGKLETKVDLSSLASGIYTVELRIANERVVEKLIIQR